MKRLLSSLFAVVAVAWIATDRATADYLEIKVDLEQIANVSVKPPTPPPGAGQPGGPPGGQPGMQPGMQRGGQPGGQPKGGKGGARGGKGGEAFIEPPARFRDGLSFVQGPPPGDPNNGPPPGPDGMPGGMPGMPGAPPPMVPLPDEAARNWIVAYIEIKGKPMPAPGRSIVLINHKYGKDFALSGDPLLFRYRPIQADSLPETFEKKFRKEIKDSKDRPGHLLYIAQWALSMGLTDKFIGVMDDLQKTSPKHAAVVNLARVKADLKKPIAGTDPSVQAFVDELKASGYRAVMSEQGHYGILAKVAQNQTKDIELKRRLNLFEETMQNFYYWFAVQEMPQPAMPQYKQWVVLPESVKDFNVLHATWGEAPLAGDGFTLRRQNIVILSPERLDEGYAALHKNNQTLWNTVKTSREEFITGSVWKRPEGFSNTENLAKVQTMTMVEKLLEEDGERQTITNQGSRQLLVASGLLPAKVDMPEWLMAGLASFLETSRDSVYGNGGYLPSWEHLVTFKQFRAQKKLDPAEADTVLLNVLTDRNYVGARILKADENRLPDSKAKEQAGEKAEDLTYMAKSTAWALTYYLFKTNKLDKLAKYCNAYADMPRDRDLGEAVYIATFAKAFDLADSTDPRKLDADKLKDFATQWFVEMQSTTLDLPQIEQEALAGYQQP